MVLPPCVARSRREAACLACVLAGTAFFRRHLKDDPAMDAYLAPGYAGTFAEVTFASR